MKKLWRPMLLVGILLLAIVLIVTPFILTLTVETEPVGGLVTPLEVLADLYCRCIVTNGLWIWLLVIGVAAVVAAIVIRYKEKE